MEGREVRESFLRFFEERGHKRVPSSSLIPPPESGLLLTNAGMNQFIPYFLGHAQAPFPRAVTAQKVFRALDIDNVGHTARHLTLFEMLGNFSFGDYFKKESCAWGLELVTQVWGIARDRIWVTVFETDDETVDIWLDIGIPRDRIVHRGVADNYWWTHAAGPAGPCSEIYVDRGERYGPEGGPAVDEERYVEIWNHVFMQDEVDDSMSIVQELPAKNIDTRAYIDRVATSEEERFASTLRQGMTLFEGEVGRAEGSIEGDVVFKLHDTYGFPKELTRELAEDAGLEIDESRFEKLMAEQRERAKRSAKRGRAEEQLAEVAAETGKTEFVGYERLESDGRLIALLSDGGRTSDVHEGQEVRFVVDRTPFYAESGGQIGDQGIVRAPGGVIRVTDAQFGPGEVIVHTGVVDAGEIHQGDEIYGEVDVGRREATARSHTATHIVHWTLRHILGEHARQAGSLVAPRRVRFDFPHHSSVPRDVLEQAEELANSKTVDDDQVTIYETTFDEAKNQGAIALFGEKYGDFVRVVEVGDYSVELCGGTHVHHTGHA